MGRIFTQFGHGLARILLIVPGLVEEFTNNNFLKIIIYITNELDLLDKKILKIE